MAKHNAFRDGKIHVCEQKCATCIFRPGNLMELSPGRVKQMIEDATRKASAIICHSTLDGDNAVCRGFFEEHCTLPLRLAVATDSIVYQPVEGPTGMSKRNKQSKLIATVVVATPDTRPTTMALWVKDTKPHAGERKLCELKCCDRNRQLVKETLAGTLMCVDTANVEHWRLSRAMTREELETVSWET